MAWAPHLVASTDLSTTTITRIPAISMPTFLHYTNLLHTGSYGSTMEWIAPDLCHFECFVTLFPQRFGLDRHF